MNEEDLRRQLEKLFERDTKRTMESIEDVSRFESSPVRSSYWEAGGNQPND